MDYNLETLKPMKDAPRDGTEILAYHCEGKTLHPIKYCRGNTWGMRWNREYSQYDNHFLGWIPMPKVVV